MRHLYTGIAASMLALALGACTVGEVEEEPQEPSQDVMRGAPIYQPARMLDRRGSAETVEYVFSSPTPPDSVASWYRNWITNMGWDVTGDAVTPDGAITIHTQRDNAPMWVIIRAQGTGSEFSLIGAAPDTSASNEP